MRRWVLIAVLLVRLGALVSLGVIVAFVIPEKFRSWDFLSAITAASIVYLGTYSGDYLVFLFSQSGGHPHDVALFRELLKILKPSMMFNVLGKTELGATFREDLINGVMDFADTWGDADKEFQDKNLEKARRETYDKAHYLAHEIALRTVAVGTAGVLRTTKFTVDTEETRAKAYSDAKVIQSAASEFVESYKRLYRLGRSKLALEGAESTES